MLSRIMYIFLYTLVFISLANAESSQAAKPSFDCAKAKSEVEKMICADESGKLQGLDKEMAKSYSNLKAKLDLQGEKELLLNQRTWLKEFQNAILRNVLKKLCKVELQK